MLSCYRKGFMAFVAALTIWSLGTDVNAAEPSKIQKTLFDYVHKDDGAFSWELVDTVEGQGHTTYVMNVVSQTWLTKKEVDRTEWRHWVVVTVPDVIKSDTAFLLIGGGGFDSKQPKGSNDISSKIAMATKSIVVELNNVPGQPLVFNQDGVKRKEDDLIGYTWAHYLKTGDLRWPARLPMVKSAVRAMDATTALLKTKGKDVNKFVVAGGSKRGWTTWLTGATDERVTAIVPIVIDVLNTSASMKHHFAAYGHWSLAVGDYVRHNVMAQMDHPRIKELYELVDPLSYKDFLQMPKYIVNAAGDEFFLPDSSQFYFDKLKGEKHLRYVPNASHSLSGSDAVETIAAFYSLVLAGKERPKYDWNIAEDGTITVKSETRPAVVKLWQAHNPKARDFRKAVIGKAYKSSIVKRNENDEYIGKVDLPKAGYTAYFLEMTYDVGFAYPIKFTTGVKVVPDVLPFLDKEVTNELDKLP